MRSKNARKTNKYERVKNNCQTKRKILLEMGKMKIFRLFKFSGSSFLGS